MIPYKAINKSDLNQIGQNSLSDFLEMEVIDIGPDFLTMKMPVTHRVHQPMGLLHGGAVAALAENVASLAGNLVVQQSNRACVGLSLNTNHIKSVKNGYVTATARPIHLGQSTHVWEVETRTESEVLINVSRMTLAVIEK